MERLLLLAGMLLALPCLPGRAAEASAPAVVLPEPAQLAAIIRERDIALFTAVFDSCDLQALKPMLADDLEFYHDRGGVTARSADEFIASIAKTCSGRASARYRSRRELVESSLRVDPIPGYGAMEIGEHRFYERDGDGLERLAGTAAFSHVWKLENGQWKISRVLSYSHRAAP